MRNRIVPVILASAVFAAGCSHSPPASTPSEELDRKVSQENAVRTRADLRAEVDRLIKSAPGLTQEERSRLSALRDATVAQSDQLRQQSLRLRAVLIQDLLSPSYNKEEVDLVKKKYKDVEHQRLTLFFSATRSANEIMGRWGSRHDREEQNFYEQLMLEMEQEYL